MLLLVGRSFEKAWMKRFLSASGRERGDGVGSMRWRRGTVVVWAPLVRTLAELKTPWTSSRKPDEKSVA